MVHMCIDFINVEKIGDLEAITFNADMLQESSKYGEWQPCTDSHISGWGLEEDERGFSIRKFLCEYC